MARTGRCGSRYREIPTMVLTRPFFFGIATRKFYLRLQLANLRVANSQIFLKLFCDFKSQIFGENTKAKHYDLSILQHFSFAEKFKNVKIIIFFGANLQNLLVTTVFFRVRQHTQFRENIIHLLDNIFRNWLDISKALGNRSIQCHVNLCANLIVDLVLVLKNLQIRCMPTRCL